MLPPALIQHPGMCTPGLCGGVFLWISFPHPGGNFLTFYASSYNVQFSLLGLSGNGSEPFGGRGGLVFPLLIRPLVHVCFSTSILWLCYVVLVPRTQNKDICPRKVLPYLPCGPFSSPIPLFLTACPCQQSLLALWLSGHRCSRRAIGPSSPGFCKGVSTDV